MMECACAVYEVRARTGCPLCLLTHEFTKSHHCGPMDQQIQNSNKDNNTISQTNPNYELLLRFYVNIIIIVHVFLSRPGKTAFIWK